MSSPSPLRPAQGIVALLTFLALVAAACGGSETDQPVDAERSATEPAAATDPSPPQATPTQTAAESGTPTENAETPTATAAEVADEPDGTAAADVAGCPTSTEIGIGLVRTDGEEEILPPTAFSGGHFVLDLDGSGFGPQLGGVLTTDGSADPVALGETWWSPDAPADGALHISILLLGPPAGATEFPLGVYGVTFTDSSFAPTEGMGLAALERHNPDGSSNPMNRDNQLELTHVGEGMICGTIGPSGREPASSNPVTEVTGSFVATMATQP